MYFVFHENKIKNYGIPTSVAVIKIFVHSSNVIKLLKYVLVLLSSSRKGL